MEFILVTLAGLAFLGLSSLALVEGAYLLARLWARLSFWWHSRRLSLRHARFASGSMKAYALDRVPSPLGQLRFTKSRARDFDGPPDSHGGA